MCVSNYVRSSVCETKVSAQLSNLCGFPSIVSLTKYPQKYLKRRASPRSSVSTYLSMQRKWLSIFGQLNDIKLYIDIYVYVQTSVDLRHCARPAAFIWSFKSVLNESRLVLHSWPWSVSRRLRLPAIWVLNLWVSSLWTPYLSF